MRRAHTTTHRPLQIDRLELTSYLDVHPAPSYRSNVLVDQSYIGGGDFNLRFRRSGERGSIFRKWLQPIIDLQWHHIDLQWHHIDCKVAKCSCIVGLHNASINVVPMAQWSPVIRAVYHDNCRDRSPILHQH